MTIYNDNAGNKFLGDCIYANHNVSYSSVNFLQAHPHSSISAELTDLCTQSGLKFRDVISQATADTNARIGNTIVLTFGANSDDIDDRYTFVTNGFLSGTSGGSASSPPVGLFNNFGFVGTTTYSNTNSLAGLGFSNNQPTISTSNISFSDSLNALTGIDFYNNSAYSILQWAGVCDGESLGLFAYIKRLTDNREQYIFYYAGQLIDVNTNNDYYSASKITSSILCCVVNRVSFTPTPTTLMGVGHYISNAPKLALTTGDAQYSIACSDGQNPTAQWATDFYVFDNNDSFGYPAIGRVRNLLLAQGDYTIGKPVKISGTVQPDNGFNAWLPVGTFAGKTVLMRCYSSASL
jgi:hypothetical protein